MQSKSSPCVFIKYSQTQSAYKCLNLKTHKIYTSRHVIFDEPNTPTLSSTKPKSQTTKSHNAPLFFNAQVTLVPSPTSSALLPASTTLEGVAAIDVSSSGNLVNLFSSYLLISSGNLGQAENSQNPNAQIISNPPVQCLHQMTTQSMNKIFKPKQLNSVSKHPLPKTIELTCVSQALSQPQWCDAMSSELTALMKHGTWDLVSIPLNYNPVGCKWVLESRENLMDQWIDSNPA
ncbi:hypothetical protein CK203_110177 [Vitis vinifera]|uniref:Retroviral polymerase SH3-like domain-containing protein n=1 Tax=Vitis vinifera TaxID=29760 RepID=A0A438FHI2_VITVI|nr:hypothetical protein CK203_110177 [Vitis vinifera]